MEQHWRIELLDGLRAMTGERVITRFRTRKAAALLAYLAYHPGPHAREVLGEMLWPGHEPAPGRNNLNVALSSLRRLLEPGDAPAGSVVVADRIYVGLNAVAVTTDVDDFEAALQAASTAQSAVAPNDAEHIQHLSAAVQLYGGALLPGHYEDWIVPEEQRLSLIHI